MLKFILNKSVLAAALALSFAVAPVSFAKEVSKKARANDIASEYVLTNDATLYRVVDGRRCDITTNVDSFKISQHPNDAAMIYYVKDGDLYVLGASAYSSHCPKANTRMIMANVKKYTVTSNPHTTVVNMALSRSGALKAWDNTNIVLSVSGVDEYQMNQNFGAEGKAFSSYVAFAHTARGGYIMKIKGRNPEGSKWDSSRYYTSVSDFKRSNGLTDLE
jgi:hypothetical protein